MQIVKIALVMMTGLGSTWVARTTTEALLPGTLPVRLVPVEVTDAAEPSAGAPASGDAGRLDAPASKPPSAPAPISREEMEAEIRRAQAEIAGKPAASDVDEFRSARPLSADIGIALPSDT
jgi:hypothetical protein